MAIYQHLDTFAGKAVADFQHEHQGEDAASIYGTAEKTLAGEPSSDAGDHAWRIGSWYEGPEFADVLQKFLDAPGAAAVTHLVVGYWGADYDEGAADPVRLLVDAADRLPSLRALFLGDIVMEQAEISWIEQSDITPLFGAFPLLEHLEVRGGLDLALRPFTSTVLKTLRFESGGLPRAVVRALGESDLPALEHLDLWLGVGNYGGDATVADLAPILGGGRLPSLRHLGLEDSEIQDELAAAVAGAPIVARLESLSLAMGVLTDRGAESLLSGQPLTHLTSLDLHHHYLTEPMADRVRAALPGVAVDLSEGHDAQDRWPYVAVSE
ncbi:STM4015 family protein [Actinomadura sp. SCN-SB]|uniref:STM4015 family protein n=1 Tax=Actinomadura sp. SCN-SB TaxID=3373092 RepID=UPI003752EF3E